MTYSAPKIPERIFNKDLEKGEKLGEGGFGIVYKGKWKDIPVAIKTLRAQELSEDLQKEFADETIMMLKLRHRSVVRLLGVCLDPGYYAMIIELMPNGDLYRFLSDKNQKLSWDQRWRFAIEIGSGLKYLHANKILHRDLKSLNILLDKKLHTKITDFGLSRIKVHSQTLYTDNSRGSLPWMAPELFGSSKVKLTSAADVYAYGMILWEIASRKVPFSNASNPHQVIAWTINGEREELSKQWPKQYVSAIKKCWHKHPDKRSTAEDLVNSLEQARPQNKTSPNMLTLSLPSVELPSPFSSKAWEHCPDFQALSIPKELPKESVSRFGTKLIGEQRLMGHTKRVTVAVQISKKILASGSEDKTIKLWNIETGKCIETFKGHKSDVTALARLSDYLFASGSADRTIKLWDVKKGECVKTLKKSKWRVTALVQLSDELLVSGQSNSIKLWNVKDGKCIKTFKRQARVACLTRITDGVVAIGGSGRSLVEIFDVNNGKCLKTMSVPNYSAGSRPLTWVTSLTKLSERFLAAVSQNFMCGVLDIESGKCIQTLPEPGFLAVTRLSSGLLAVSRDLNMVVGIYDTRAKLFVHHFSTSDVFKKMIQLSDGRLVGIGVDSLYPVLCGEFSDVKK